MYCIKIVYINSMMTFVIDKNSIEGGQQGEGVWFSLRVRKFMYRSIRLDDETVMFGNFKSLVL